jgi:hypothetical protein
MSHYYLFVNREKGISFMYEALVDDFVVFSLSDSIGAQTRDAKLLAQLTFKEMVRCESKRKWILFV